jgi:hypothetical protein
VLANGVDVCTEGFFQSSVDGRCLDSFDGAEDGSFGLSGDSDSLGGFSKSIVSVVDWPDFRSFGIDGMAEDGTEDIRRCMGGLRSGRSSSSTPPSSDPRSEDGLHTP